MTKGMGIFLGIGIGIALLILMIYGWIAGYYNNFVVYQTQVDTAWGQVETQYQRRFDLIPSLVNATKGIFEQEREVFGAIAEARTKYAGSKSVESLNQLETALSRLLVVIENYPQLHSSETVKSLMDELAGTENRINVSRQRYNEDVRNYTILIRRFPGKLFASLFGFNARNFFKGKEGTESAPIVDLSLGGRHEK